MARTRRGSPAVRSLVALVLVFAAVFAVVAVTAATVTGKKWTPELGLDLAGGTQIVLKPVVVGGAGKVSPQQLAQSVDIIRARIDGSGVGEAEITTEGGENVVVAVPGTLDQKQSDLIKQSSQLRFRAVLVSGAGVTAPVPAPTPSGPPSATPSTAPTQTPTATSGQASPSSSPSTSAKSGLPQALLAATTTPPPSATPAVTPTPAPAPGAANPTDGSDLAQITPALQQEFIALDCSRTSAVQGSQDDPKKPLVTCSDDKTEKFILGPAEVIGTDIADATAGLRTNSQGNITNEWAINLSFDGAGTTKFRTVTARITSLEAPRNRFAVVLDGQVITAPTSQAVITNGQAEISGSFTQESATALANQLKYGALPISFTTETQTTISPLLGSEQLQRGLLAGLIGLLLVVVYSVIQYRGLAMVSIASLLAAAALTYGMVVLLGQTQGFRLSLAGITGLIVSIGITADSFIVYFERVRDEVREGRSLRAAVETGWKRAKRTILAADGINFLAAVVLYVLAAGNVRGFAYTLGLTTIIDVVVVFLFTHPMLTLLARTRFFGGGHRLSGLDPEHLGSTVRVVGIKANVGTIAGRRAAAARSTPKEA